MILEKLLQNRFSDVNVYLTLWAIFCGAKIQHDSWNIEYEESTLMATFVDKNDKAELCPEVLQTILALTKSCIREFQKFSGSELDVSKSANLNAAHLENIAKTNLSFMGGMYWSIPQIRDIILRQESIDDFIKILYELVSTEVPISISQELKESPESIKQELGRSSILNLNFIADAEIECACLIENRFKSIEKQDG